MNKEENLNKPLTSKSNSEDKSIEIIEESINIDKVVEATAEITVNKDVEFTDEVLEIPIQKEEISIEHIPVGKVIENYPVVREVDGKTIIPVVKERLVVTKELFLEEEIHITRNNSEEIQKVKETLRKDVVNIKKKKL